MPNQYKLQGKYTHYGTFYIITVLSSTKCKGTERKKNEEKFPNQEA